MCTGTLLFVNKYILIGVQVHYHWRICTLSLLYMYIIIGVHYIGVHYQ